MFVVLGRRSALGDDGFVFSWEAGAGLSHEEIAALLDRVLATQSR